MRTVEASITRLFARMSPAGRAELARVVTRRRTGATVSPPSRPATSTPAPVSAAPRGECVCGLPAGHP